MCHLSFFTWLIGAEWLFTQVFKRHTVRSGATAAAHVFELAEAALTAKKIRVAEFLEEWRAVPDFLEGFIADISGLHGQVATGEDFAFMRDEADTRRGQAAFGGRVHVFVPMYLPVMAGG